MKRYQLFLLLACTVLACKKDANDDQKQTENKVSTFKNTSIKLTIANLSANEIEAALNGSISGTTLYSKNGVEHLIISPTLFFNEPLIPAIHLIKKNGEWVYENYYAAGAMGAGRDSEYFDDAGTIVFADHGLELRQGTWPFGNLMMAKTNGEQLSWSNISTDRSFYHSISTGDLNNDGLKDVIGLHMGTKSNWFDNLHPYLQKSNGSFEADRNLISYTNWPGLRGAGAVLVSNIMDDARPEIIMADYGPDPHFPRIRYSFAIFSFSSQTGKYEFVKTPGVLGFATRELGVTSIKAVDFDKDGDLDIALAYESSQINGLEIWTNNGNGNYTFSNDRLEYNFSELQFREFEIADVDKDGWQDIVLNAWQGNLFKGNFATGEVFLHNLIWKNNKGKFEKLSAPKAIYLGETPAYIKTFLINNKLRFIGIRGSADGRLIITDIDPVF
jgi:hypothetical protein